jgi:resuscitation-promoting factor RpfA
MKFPDTPSLTPEERDLAQRIAQSGPPREPSSALDARILAAARVAATATPAATSARLLPRRRWPVALGLAASLVLAVGVAWRLRPLPETPADSRPEAPARSAARSVAASAPVEAMVEAQPPAASDSSVAATAPAAETQPPAPTPLKSAAVEMREVAQDRGEPAVVFDLPAQSTAAKMATPSAAPMADDAAPQAFESTASSRRAAAIAPSTPPAATQAQSASNEAARAAIAGVAADTGALHADEPADDVPPATADSPAVRDAWLQRIRGLVDDGDVAAARASLHEFVRRYPTFALPEDLRALER